MSRKRNVVLWMVVLLLAAVAMIGYKLRGRFLSAPPAEAEPASETRLPVAVTSIRAMRFEEGVSVSGNVLSKRFAKISARIPGTLDAIYVDEGDWVEAGKTQLFQTDRLKLDKAVEIARQERSVAECAVRVNQANLESIQADYDKARIDYERYQRLFESDRAVTQDAVEMQRSRFLQLEAHRKLAKVQIELSEKQQEQAKSNLAIAEKDLRDSLVYAPITGLVTKRFMEPGEMPGNGDPVVELVDPSAVELSAFLPEEYYARVRPGETILRVRIEGIDVPEQVLSYRSPTVSPDLRTFEIKCVIEQPPQALVAGRIIQVDVVLASHEGLGTPVDALKQMRDGPVLFTIHGGRARMIQVQPGLQTDGWIELVDSPLPEGTPVVTMGQDFLEDGAAVRIVEEA